MNGGNGTPPAGIWVGVAWLFPDQPDRRFSGRRCRMILSGGRALRHVRGPSDQANLPRKASRPRSAGPGPAAVTSQEMAKPLRRRSLSTPARPSANLKDRPARPREPPFPLLSERWSQRSGPIQCSAIADCATGQPASPGAHGAPSGTSLPCAVGHIASGVAVVPSRVRPLGDHARFRFVPAATIFATACFPGSSGEDGFRSGLTLISHEWRPKGAPGRGRKFDFLWPGTRKVTTTWRG